MTVCAHNNIRVAQHKAFLPETLDAKIYQGTMRFVLELEKNQLVNYADQSSSAADEQEYHREDDKREVYGLGF